MRIENGFFMQLLDEFRGRVLYSVSTDQITDDEFDQLWLSVGKQIRRELHARANDKKADQSQFEFRVRGGFITGTTR